jgi:hypothetical protein
MELVHCVNIRVWYYCNSEINRRFQTLLHREHELKLSLLNSESLLFCSSCVCKCLPNGHRPCCHRPPVDSQKSIGL